jgi:hypothetical protein
MSSLPSVSKKLHRDIIVNPRARPLNPHRRNCGEGTFTTELPLSAVDEKNQARLRMLERAAGVR